MAGSYNAKTQFRANITPYLKEIKAQITSVANQANSVTGAYRGSFATLAGMPTTSPVKTGDWAILNTEDGSNESGIYVKSATVWQFVQDITNFAEIVEGIIATNAEVAAGTSTTKAVNVQQLASVKNTLQANIDDKANLGGSDRRQFLVADADESSKMAVNASQLTFAVTNAEATLDYNNA